MMKKPMPAFLMKDKPKAAAKKTAKKPVKKMMGGGMDYADGGKTKMMRGGKC